MTEHGQRDPGTRRFKPPHVGVVVGYVLGLLVILGLMWTIASRVL